MSLGALISAQETTAYLWKTDLGWDWLVQGEEGMVGVGVALVGTAAAEVGVGTHRVGALMVEEAEGVGQAMAPHLQTPTRPSQHKPPMTLMQLVGMMAAEGRPQAWEDPPSPRKPGRVTGPVPAATPTMLGGELLTKRLVSQDVLRGWSQRKPRLWWTCDGEHLSVAGRECYAC